MEAFVITPLLVLNPTVDTRACRGGWRDVMINFCITKDDGLHICELQIAHKQMMTARKGLPGHAVYNRVRDALARTVSLIQLHTRSMPSSLPFTFPMTLTLPSIVIVNLHPMCQYLCTVMVALCSILTLSVTFTPF